MQRKYALDAELRKLKHSTQNDFTPINYRAKHQALIFPEYKYSN